MIALNPSLTNFWMNDAILWYLNIIEFVLSQGSYARKSFLNFLRPDNDIQAGITEGGIDMNKRKRDFIS